MADQTLAEDAIDRMRGAEVDEQLEAHGVFMQGYSLSERKAMLKDAVKLQQMQEPARG